MSSISYSRKRITPIEIPLKEIVSATNNFSDTNLLAENELKKAYKGQLLRSKQQIDIVVERFLQTDERGAGSRLLEELKMLADLDHENVVTLFGFCGENDEMIIIFKDKPKGSLDTYLTDPALTWVRRLEICVGVSRALNKMKHHIPSTRMKIDHGLIHRNISSSNILLDEKWKPKLSGFEHCIKLYIDDRDRGVYADVAGTKGYIDPNHEKTGMVNYYSDVYSFGVVLFEVLCGRRAYVPSKEDSEKVDPDGELLAPLAKFCYEAGKVDDLVDAGVWEQMDPKSFKIFSDTAYECLHEDSEKRPIITEICKRLEEALDLQRKHERLTKSLELVEFGFKDIVLATENFSERNIIGSGGFGTVYKAILKHSDNRSSMALDERKSMDMPKTQSSVAIKCIKDKGGDEGFSAEIKMLGRCRHRNIVSLLGFCDEGLQKILVYEYVSKGSLDTYLERNVGIKRFKLVQRLQMCLDIAQGLKYLHIKRKIIHRDIKSANILLDDDWVAKIADFGLSKIGPMNQEVSYLNTLVAGTSVYLDPEYEKTNELRQASDIYSLGVVLFEIMSGTLAYDMCYTKVNVKGLAPFVRQQYVEKGTIKDMLDPNLKEEIVENVFTPGKGPNQDSLKIFFDIAYGCLAETQAQRPNIETVVQKLKESIDSQNNRKSVHQIPVGAIKSATDNFNDNNIIGRGAFGRYYKGKVTNADGIQTDIALQRLDTGGDGSGGETEFWMELEILTKYRHENVVSLLGYCDESDEKIIVYEYASRGSLDTHLHDPNLTWKQRLQICIDVANGLYFLQGGGAGEEFVIHGNIKSAKILLTQEWKAKLCDFGFSVITDQKNTEFVINKAHSTKNHRDPSYEKFGLTKESDILSFSVLLMEIYIGMTFSVMNSANAHPFMFEVISEQIAPKSSTSFQKLMSECATELQKQQTIGDVLQGIKQALEFQVDYEIWKPKLPYDCEQIFEMSNSPEDYKNEKEEFLYHMLVKGILLEESTMLFTLGDNGERNLMAPAKTFSYVNRSLRRWRSIPESRFQEAAEMLDILNLNIKIKTKAVYLSPNVNYGVYLVFKFCEPTKNSSKPLYVNLKYQYGGLTSYAYFARRRDTEWMMIELARFLNSGHLYKFTFLLESFSHWNYGDSTIYVEGVEYRPITQDETNELNKVQQVMKLDSDMDLLQELPIKYREILERIENDDGGEELYWLREVNEKKHLMLSAKTAFNNYYDAKLFKMIPSTQSRFPEVIELLPQQGFRIKCAVKSQMLSRDIDYACYLVFRFSEIWHGLCCPIKVRELLHSTDKETEFIYFRSQDSLNLPDHQIPEQRADGWMEVRVWKFNLNREFEDDYLHVNLRLISCEETISDLIVCGLELRPM